MEEMPAPIRRLIIADPTTGITVGVTEAEYAATPVGPNGETYQALGWLILRWTDNTPHAPA